MVYKFKKFIEESTWNDIRKQSSGSRTRYEDKVTYEELCSATATTEQLYNYILQNYEFKGDNRMVFDRDDDRRIYKLTIPITVYGEVIVVEPDYMKKDAIYALNIPAGYVNFVKRLKNYKVDDEILDNNLIRAYTSLDQMSKNEVVDFIDEMIGHVYKPALVKKTNESVWNDIRKQSSGSRERREDDIDILDHNEFYDYIKSVYMKRNGAKLPDVDMSDYVSVPIFSKMVSQNPFFLYLDNPLCKGHTVTITFSDKDKKDSRTYEIYKIIKNNYKTSEFTSRSPEFPWLAIYPKDGSDVTNKFFLEVIEFIRSNLPGSLTQALARKKVNESVWNDIRKQSAGKQERAEDNIDSLKLESFVKYLQEKYFADTATGISYSDKFGDISVPVLIYKDEKIRFGNYSSVYLNKFKNTFIYDQFKENLPGAYSLLNEHFKLKKLGTNRIEILPSDGKNERTNSFFIEVIEFILDNAQEEKLLERRP